MENNNINMQADTVAAEAAIFSTPSHATSNVYAMALLPTQPKSLAETGLSQQLVTELVAKTMMAAGKIHLLVLSAKLKLSINVLNEILNFMVVEHMAEIVRRGTTETDVDYQLTIAGKKLAGEWMNRCSYIGPAPVTLKAYHDMVVLQSIRGNRVTAQDMQAAFADITLNPDVRNQVGAAMNSGRPLFLYGPAGSGKTFISEKLNRLLPGSIAVPHAVTVENEIIQVYDTLLHEQAAADAQPSLGRPNSDSRWVLCKRPVVVTGGELTLDMLDLTYDAISGFYQSPPHFKANNGIFIIDDLGRQKVSPQHLMNRWVVPMDRGRDYLALHTGYKFTVPFDVVLVFSTNLSPSTIADESFLRRLGYKIYVGPLSESEYRSVFRQQAETLGIAFNEIAFSYLLYQLHQGSGRPLLACYARDLLSQMLDYARYFEEPVAMTATAFDQAWHTYFAKNDEEI